MRKYTTNVIAIFIALSSATISLGQTVVKAVILDEITSEPLKNVAVETGSGASKQGTTTNRKGEFEITVKAVSDPVSFTHLGFKTKRMAASSVPAQVILFRSSTNLGEVEINPKKDLFPNMIGFPTSKPSAPRQTSNASMLGTLNNLPGVMLDERGQGGSRRLSIRGSSLRAPFGVRNVKLYWNYMPITSPDGSSPLEVIDPAMTARMDVIKGPVANMYGAVNGGTLKFNTKGYSGENSRMLRLSSTVGDFGLQRNDVQFFMNTNKLSIDLFYTRQQYGGFRQQEFNNKDHFAFQIGLGGVRHTFSLFGYYFDGAWGLPGAIDSATVAEDPTLAASFAVENNTRVERMRYRTGLRHRFLVTQSLELATVVYGNTTTKDNPYGTSAFFNGYKQEDAQGFGGRSELIWNHTWKRLKGRFYVGGEFQQEANILLESPIENGQPSTDLYQDSRTVSTNAFGFAQADIKNTRWGTTLTLALNYGQLKYDHADRLDTDPIDYSGTRDFAPQFLPRIGLLKTMFKKKVTLYGDLAYGQSAPALWETLQSNGAMNSDLQAENSTLIEFGVKTRLLKYKLNLDVNVYQMTLDNAIVSSVDSTGLTTYQNTGALTQQGFEASARYMFISDQEKKVSLLTLWSTVTLQDFRFTDYVKDGEDLNGNLLPGSADVMINGGLNVGFLKGFYLNVTTRYVGAMAMNDDNTTFSDPYLLLGSRAGYRWRIGDNMSCEVYGGGNNLLDETYSSFLQLNGFGGRFYNPAATRNFYGGAQFSWKF
jgi:iron complex outermembrane receptor protein